MLPQAAAHFHDWPKEQTRWAFQWFPGFLRLVDFHIQPFICSFKLYRGPHLYAGVFIKILNTRIRVRLLHQGGIVNLEVFFILEKVAG